MIARVVEVELVVVLFVAVNDWSVVDPRAKKSDVVVAPPKMVRPVEAVPPPMVEEAEAPSPPKKFTRVVVPLVA